MRSTPRLIPDLEPLESRTLCAAMPRHLELAEAMVASIRPADNSYSHAKAQVAFQGLQGATRYFNKSDCSSFVTRTLQASYSFSDAQIVQWTGRADPKARDYFNAALADKGFQHFSDVQFITPGDLVIIKYDHASNTGHIAFILQSPTLIQSNDSQRIYDLPILDCTSTPHGPSDARYPKQTGVGKGTLRLYTDANGNVQGYAWSNSDKSKPADPATRHILLAHIPAVPEPAAWMIALLLPVNLLRRKRRRLSTSPLPRSRPFRSRL